VASWEELTELKYIGEKSAKRLYKKGYTTRNDILQVDSKELARIIGLNAYKVKKENQMDFSKFFEGGLVVLVKKRVLDGLQLFKRFLSRQKEFNMGIYGPANVGKTTLANKISMDFLGEKVGSVSNIPHETTEVIFKKGIELAAEKDGKKVRVNLADTPGLTTKINLTDFKGYGLNKKQMEERRQKAAMGVIDAIKWLDKMDIALFMLDASRDAEYENIILLENFKLRKIPFIVVANKMDLKKASVNKIREKYPEHQIVGISAKKGHNMNEFYKSVMKTVKAI